MMIDIDTDLADLGAVGVRLASLICAHARMHVQYSYTYT
jgi:hypothetical protein